MSSQIVLNELGSDPGTPAAGKVSFYVKTDGGIYIKDDTGTETTFLRLMVSPVAGGLLFPGASAGSLEQDADNLFWDNDNSRLGIGTDAPTSRLHVTQAGTVKNTTDVLTLTNTGNAADMDGTGTALRFQQSYYDAVTPVVADSGRIAVITEQDWTSTASTRDSRMSFQLSADGTVAEKMSLTSAGHLGLGITSPMVQEWRAGTYLTVSNSSTRGIVEINSNAADSGSATLGALVWSYATNTTNHKNVAVIEVDTAGGTANQRGSVMKFFTKANGTASPAERMRIDNGGHVGIGVTPSSWGAAIRTVEIGNGSFVAGHTSLPITYLGANAYHDGSDWKYKTTGPALYMDASGQVGAFRWNTAASGTAGNTITFSTVMTLDTGGNLGIGVTPSAWSTVAPVFQIGPAGSYFASQGASIWAGMGTNGYYDGSTWRHVVNGVAGAYFINGNVHEWRVGSSGTAGNTISWTQAMMIDAASSVLVGKTSDAFDVAGIILTNSGLLRVTTDQTGDVVAMRSRSASQTGNLIYMDAARNTTDNSYYAISYWNNGASAYKFRVADSGNVTNANNSYGGISDEKLKDILDDAPGSKWEAWKALRWIKYRLKKEGQTGPVYFGLGANHTEGIIPGVVESHADTEPVEVIREDGSIDMEHRPTGTFTKSIKYSVVNMIGEFVLQEAQYRIETAESRIDANTSDILAIKSALAAHNISVH